MTREVIVTPRAPTYPRSMSSAPIGTLVKEWRSQRRRSQMDLAHEVGVSTRHLSFVETGRSKPSPELVLQRSELGVAGEHDGAADLAEEVRGPVVEVERPGRQPLRVQAHAEHVDARREDLRRDAGQERLRGRVRDDDVPLPVDHDARVRVVRVEQSRQRGTRRAHGFRVEVEL